MREAVWMPQRDWLLTLADSDVELLQESKRNRLIKSRSSSGRSAPGFCFLAEALPQSWCRLIRRKGGQI
jgi:hypothetical protein